MTDLANQRIEELWARNEELIRGPYKCALMGVAANPPFHYTIGLTDMGWPELFCIGLHYEIGGMLINGIVQNCLAIQVTPRDRMQFTSEELGMSVGVRLEKMTQEHVGSYMFQSVFRQERVKGPWPTGLQVIYPDRNGRWPGDPSCEEKVRRVQDLETLPASERADALLVERAVELMKEGLN